MPRSPVADEPELAADETRVRTGTAQVLADADRPGGHLLLVDRIRQSYVDLDDPTYLDFEYVQDMAAVIDAIGDGRLDVTHIGGGALTVPRYIAQVRPHSSQIVLEPDVELTDLVRRRLPVPARSGIRVRPVGGREGIAALPDAGADLVVLDAFVGGRVPAELTTVEFVADIARILRPDGVLLANLPDGPPLRYLRRALAAMRTEFGATAAVGDAGVLRGRRYGNVVVAASRRRLPVTELRRRIASAPFPRRVLAGAAMNAFVAEVKPLVDADSMRSPTPPESVWRVVGDPDVAG